MTHRVDSLRGDVDISRRAGTHQSDANGTQRRDGIFKVAEMIEEHIDYYTEDERPSSGRISGRPASARCSHALMR
jgi:hypothetical protein